MPLINLLVNDVQHQVDVDPAMPLLWVLRDVLGLTGPKHGCGIGQCGELVLVNPTETDRVDRDLEVGSMR